MSLPLSCGGSDRTIRPRVDSCTVARLVEHDRRRSSVFLDNAIDAEAKIRLCFVAEHDYFTPAVDAKAHERIASDNLGFESAHRR